MKQSLADRNIGDKLIDTKLWGVHSTDSRLQPSRFVPPAYDMGTDLVIMRKISKS